VNTPRSNVRRLAFPAILCLYVAVAVSALTAEPLPSLETSARQWREELSSQIMPYWLKTLDQEHGGYHLADDGKGQRPASEKQLVSQTRMIWTFSLVHRLGMSRDNRNYLNAAAHGYRFLSQSLFDTRHGGYFWKTDPAGKPLNDCKFLYGQAFVVYALVEYHRASGEREPLQRAFDLYHTIQQHLHDPDHGGWFEHAESNWRLLNPGDRRNEVEVVGFKSANAHLHWMEALTELYDVTRDPAVKKSLQEAVRINMKYFYPRRAGESSFHRQPDWKPVTDQGSAGLSYGHNVEFAWLMIRAEQTLGRKPSWRHFYAHLDHALRYGYDHQLGGLYNRGYADQPATDTAKVWWVQAEMLAALTDALSHRPDADYSTALQQLIQFIRAYQADPRDGIWFDTVTATGQPVRAAKAHSWKANYHDVRAITKYISAFDRQPESR
jgi:mannobiose 2-epimerase